MKAAIAQINTTVGDIKGNCAKIEEYTLRAKELGSTIVIFSDGALTGTPLLDLAMSDNLIMEVNEELQKLAERLPMDMEVVIGGSETFIMSSIAHLKQGKIKYLNSNIIRHKGQKIKALLGMPIFQHSGAERLLGNMVDRQNNESDYPIVAVNGVGASTDIIWGGGSFALSKDGGQCVRLPMFEEALQVVDTDDIRTNNTDWGDKITQLHRALVMGVSDYFNKNGFDKACVALSGGIDSAVVVAIAVEALGADRVRVILLPSALSSDHSVDDSLEMVRRTGVKSDTVPIEPIFAQAIEALTPIFDGKAPNGLAHENMQSRIRLMLTMALSNQTGALMLNTSNKSEVAVGYGTLYGDTSGALGVIADIYKCEVYALARHINSHYADIIPQNIIDKAPSAELRPDQKDSDSLPDYQVLDKLLYLLIEQGKTAGELLLDNSLTKLEKQELPRVAKLVWNGDFKRHQLPPAIRVSGATFNGERLYPITKSKFRSEL